jgi:hypothetical protein
MQQPDLSNQHFQMAVKFVNQTSKNLFLTGKAGTGKTTFLKHIKESSPKRLAVVAPTGVAAINAGGVTIHSLFQLPFGSFLPGNGQVDFLGGNFFNRQSLLKHLRLGGAKRELMQELELLIIDEVSMVRSDLMDAIDTVLRFVRKEPNTPFGGVQMLFIGDLFQLPPVVKDTEERVLRQYYESPFFFHAQVLQQDPPLYLELKKIYRQSDQDFISLLNNLRNNRVSAADLSLLRSYHKPNFKPQTKGEYITLTSHNAKADVINRQELTQLPGKIHEFHAKLEGEFNENALPAEKTLQLKEGAQIMFIKNDKGETRRFYNGKTGMINRIKGEEIYVTFPDEPGELLVEKEVWENIRYQYNNETEQVEETVKGTFTQFPLRLAWAITIHKSQGLTFAKAIVDAGDSFAAGQVYVALSRLRSLEGLVLKSPIHEGCISTDMQATAYASTEPDRETLLLQLKEAQKQFIHNSLLRVFNWQKVFDRTQILLQELPERRIPLQEEAISLVKGLLGQLQEQMQIAGKFSRQLEQWLPLAEADGYRHIHQRTKSASLYFKETLEKTKAPLFGHILLLQKQPKKPRKHLKELENLLLLLEGKVAQLDTIVLTSAGLMEGNKPEELLDKLAEERLAAPKQKKEDIVFKKGPKKKQAPKGESMRISLKMYREGKSIFEIAKERNLATGTIESHLASFIPTGEVALEELVSLEKIKAIQAVLDESEEELKSSQIREILGEEYSYAEIRAVMASQPKAVNE